MNPVFWLIVIAAAVVAWFLGSFMFYPLGRYLYRLWKDAVDEMEREDEEIKG